MAAVRGAAARGRRLRAVLRGRRGGHRRCDRDQPDDAGLRLAARPDPARRGRDPARDRAQRRRRRGQPASLRLGPQAGRAGPPRCMRWSDAPAPAAEPETLDERASPIAAAFSRAIRASASPAATGALVERVAEASRPLDPDGALALAVARNYSKLLAYKDEYEVARLYTERRVRAAPRRAVRGRLQARACTSRRRSSPASIRTPDGPRKRRFGRLDAQGVPRAGEGALPARHALRPVRPQRGAARRAAADQGLRGADRGDPGRARCATGSRPRWRSPRCRTRSAASARSRPRRSRRREARKAALLERFRQGPPPETRTEAA